MRVPQEGRTLPRKAHVRGALRGFQQLRPVRGSLPLGLPLGAGCGNCCLSDRTRLFWVQRQQQSFSTSFTRGGSPVDLGSVRTASPLPQAKSGRGRSPRLTQTPALYTKVSCPTSPGRTGSMHWAPGPAFSQHFTHSYFAARRCCWSNAKLKVSRAPPGHRVPSASSPVCVSLA